MGGHLCSIHSDQEEVSDQDLLLHHNNHDIIICIVSALQDVDRYLFLSWLEIDKYYKFVLLMYITQMFLVSDGLH